MTSIKYVGENKFEINNKFNSCIEYLNAAISCLEGKSIPSDLSEINNLKSSLTAIVKIVSANKNSFFKACQSLNDKEGNLVSSINGLEYFNINKFTFSNGKIGLVSIFNESVDLSFLNNYMSEDKWINYYSATIEELTKKKDNLCDLVNRTVSEKELQELRNKYPYLKFEYNKKTGKARILTPEEIQKHIEDSSNKGSVGNVVSLDIAKYKKEYEKWFEEKYKRTYNNYKEEIGKIEQDIVLLNSLKHDSEQVIKMKDYDNIKNSEDYKKYNQDYYKNHHGININEEIKMYANAGYDDLVTGTKQYTNNVLRNCMKYLNDDQKMMYCYLYNSKGQAEANKYLDALEDRINRIKGMEKNNQFIEKVAKRDENGNIITEKVRDKNGNIVEQVVLDTSLFSGNYIDTALVGLGMGVNNFGEGLENIFSNTGTISSNQYAQMYIMNSLYNAKESGQSVDALTGTLEMSINTGNMLPSIAISTALTFLCPPAATGGVAIGNIAGSTLMGLSAAGNAKNQAYLSGANDLQANLYGALNGLSETTLGYFLGRIPGLSGASRGFIGDMASEGLEEFTQEYVDAALRAGILGEKIDFNELSTDATKSFLMGATSSGMMNIGMHPINNAMVERNVSVMAEQIASQRGLGKESIPVIKNIIREQIKLAEEQNVDSKSNKANNNEKSPKVIPISPAISQSTPTEQTGVKEGKVINFNTAVENMQNNTTENTSSKKEYAPPKVEVKGIAMEEEVANNDITNYSQSNVQETNKITQRSMWLLLTTMELYFPNMYSRISSLHDMNNSKYASEKLLNELCDFLIDIKKTNNISQIPKLSELFYKVQSRDYSMFKLQGDGTYSLEYHGIKESLKSALYLAFENDLDFISDAEKIITLMEDKAKSTIETLHNKKINDYYGTPIYMNEHTDYIVDSIQTLINSKYINESDKNIVLSSQKKFNELIKEFKTLYSSISDENITGDQYALLSSKYSEIVSLERNLSPIVDRVWNSYFSQTGAALAHCFQNTGHIIEDFNSVKICTSLLTDQDGTLFGKSGILFRPNFSDVDAIAPHDAGSWDISLDEFIGANENDDIATSWQFINDSHICYEGGDHSLLYSPESIEAAISTKKGEDSYTEIVLRNNGNLKPYRFFLLPDASQEVIDNIFELADNYGVEVEYIGQWRGIVNKEQAKSIILDGNNSGINVIKNVEKIININHEVADVIDVSQLDMTFKRTNLLSGNEYNLNQSYIGFDYVVRPNASLDATIAEIINNNDGSNILIEIANANELTEELVSNLPDNVSIRISNYNDNYYTTFDNAHESSNGILRHLTYTALELREIMDKIKTIESGIDSSWNDYQKAQYIYDYLRDNITYHSTEDMYKILPLDQ